ncbi:MAG: hypothetical protein VX777_02285 [Chlamydiota bacterium]|nr:hypothetical protein [Chlamydiota bacterium]
MLFILMFKKWLFAVSIVLISVTALSWNSLLGNFIEFYLNNYCIECFGTELKSDSYALNSSQFILNSPKLKSTEGIDEGGLKLSAEKIIVDYKIHFLSLTVDLDVVIETPKLNLNKSYDLSALFERLMRKTPFVTFRPNFEVCDGQLSLHDYESVTPKKHKLFFSTAVDVRHHRYARLAISLDDKDLTQNSINVDFFRDENVDFSLNAKFMNANIGVIAQMFSQMHPMIQHWIIASGIADGQISVVRPHGRHMKARGVASLKEIILLNPQMDFIAKVESFDIDLTRRKSEGRKTLGRIELGGNSSFSIVKGGRTTWEIQNFLGSLLFERHGNVHLSLKGDCLDEYNDFATSLEGNARLFDDNKTFLSLNLKTQHPDQKEGVADIVFKQLDSLWNSAEIHLKNISHREFQFLQVAMSSNSNLMNNLHFTKGILQAEATAFFKGFRINNLSVKSLEVEDIVFDYYPWDIYGYAEKINGEATVNFNNPNVFDSLNAELNVVRGLTRFVGLNKELWTFSDIETQVNFKNGVIQKSEAQANFAGLKGTIEMDWLTSNDIFKLRFKGNPRELTHHVNERIRRGIQEKFMDDSLTFSAGVRNTENGLHVEGILEVESATNSVVNDIAFGFDINKVNAKLGISIQNITELGSWETVSVTSFKKIMPGLASPMVVLNDHWMDREKGVSGYVVKNGWFYAENLPLGRYVAPFAFQSDTEDLEAQLNLEGYGDFRGTFDQTGLALSYGARDVVVESEDFRIEVPQIFHHESDRADLQSHAFHVVEFNNTNHFGSIPIVHGTYMDKNSGLVFNEVSTRMKLEAKQIHATDIETFCQGIFFGGDINIDISSPEKNTFDVEIIVDTMNGKVSQVQSLFSHFDKPPLFINFPMEGDIRFRNEGGFLAFQVRPSGTQVQTKFEGVLTDGNLKFSPLDMSLTELEMNISYDQIQNILDLDDIQGTILVGKPGKIEEYIFSGEKLVFSDFQNNVSEFDLWIGHKNRDIMRIVGTTKGKKDIETESDWVEFEVDKKLTHFGDVFPSTFVLRLKDWQIVEEFQLDLKLRLSTLFNDLKRVSRTGIFFLPEVLIQELNKIDVANGDFRINLNYSETKDLFSYDAMGNDIKIGPYNYETVLFNGTLKDRVWSIDQLSFDDLSVAAEILRKEKSWRVNFLGLRSGNSILMGLEGEYFDGAEDLEAKVNLLEVNLDHLNEWSQLQEFFSKNNPKGYLRGNGKLLFGKDPRTASWNYDGFFTMTGSNVVIRDIAFGTAPSFSCQIQKDKGLTVRNITTVMLAPHGRHDTVDFHIEKVHYDLSKDQTSIEGVQMNIPHTSLQWFAAKMRYAFLEDISQNTQNIIASIKNHGTVNPIINLNLYPDSHLLTLRLPPDTYNYAGNDHILNDFLMTHEPQNMIITTGYRYHQKNFWVTFHSRDPNVDRGTIVLSDRKPDTLSKNYESIYFNWENDPYSGFYILEAKGHLGGVNVNFVRDLEKPKDSNYAYLTGKMSLSIPESLNFCEKDFKGKCIENKIGGELNLNGKLALSKNVHYNTEFLGAMQGQKIKLKGYLFDFLRSKVSYTTDALSFTDFTLEDASGEAEIPEIVLKKTPQDYWWMTVPDIHVKNLRPSRLKEVGVSQGGKISSLIFNNIDVKNVVGQAGDTSTWTGSGALKFSNPPRTNLQHTILALPHEIITRIGLNPAVLTPVTGVVYYDINDGKIVFTKFKDIFSESRGSKFYLPSTSNPSYIDFDGKMYIQVRMKQYNLLFKFAELITVTVKGSIENPVYSIRQEKGQNTK